MYDASTIDLSILFSGDIPLFHADNYFFLSRKDAKAQSFVLCFLGGASREFWTGSAICVTEVFRIKKLSHNI